MTTDQEPITPTYLHLIRTGDGWKMADALWLPR
jgi:hypothetical protein